MATHAPADGLPPLIPREILFGNPEKLSPQVSPDGRLLAFVAPAEGVLNVWVGPIDGAAFRPVTRDRDRGIHMYTWAHDGKHLIYLQDMGGDENWRLHRVDPETEADVDLTPFPDVQVQIIAHAKQHPHELVIGMNRDDPRVHDAYHVDLRTGALTLAAKNPGNVVNWIADVDLAVRAATAAREDGGVDLLVRDEVGGDWRTAAQWDPDDALNSAPAGFTRDGRALYLIDARDANTGRLRRLDLATARLQEIAGDPVCDVGDLTLQPDTHEVQMVTFVRARSEPLVLDETIRADVAALRALDDGDFTIISRSHADDVWIVSFDGDDRPVSYYCYHRATKRGRLLFTTQSQLAAYTLARMTPVSFPARDGLTLHAYLTMPPQTEPRALPLVVLVHGGPWYRDFWGYDPEVQWLANRGYAVLQVNFRGSTGYGKAFINAGDREWGRKMLDDLVDGVRWAVADGVADSHRVAIYGGSYGGYAALAGATFTPELFCCAVDIVGPSNLITFINTIPPYWTAHLSMLHRRVGHPEHDEAFLRSRSPLFHADRITIPMLIAQGANDPRVKQAESEQIVAALAARGLDHEYMLFPDEGHGFAKPQNRLKFYAAAERFLTRHLGGRMEP